MARTFDNVDQDLLIALRSKIQFSKHADFCVGRSYRQVHLELPIFATAGESCLCGLRKVGKSAGYFLKVRGYNLLYTFTVKTNKLKNINFGIHCRALVPF